MSDQSDAEVPAAPTQPMSHDEELRDIALKSAARASAVHDLGDHVKVLTTEVVGLRGEVAKAVKQDELRHVQRQAILPLWIIALSGVILVIGGVLFGLSITKLQGIARDNRQNGAILISCTTPPPANPTKKQLAAHECFVRSTGQTAAAVRHLECTNILIHGVPAPLCDDVRADLTKQGVVLPTPSTTRPTPSG